VHYGYASLDDPVEHTRRIVLDKNERTLTITDRLHCQRPHEIEQYWHFAEGLDIVANDGILQIRMDGDLARMRPDPTFELELVTGREDPPAGWRSIRYGEKLPCPTLVAKASVRGDTEFRTILELAARSDGIS
jgi:hypothetical protein